ncbi:hypothetical protein QN277_010784 [Acacia crassicarpa]|uniref:Uncharacterized protein n=1 Tax=Acacia crassicarpa TaxID=499986 RepID=A0AAE1JHG0_9FABA|nr:hypothetical protein QN277_010784 [Acacia crassicarpa]
MHGSVMRPTLCPQLPSPGAETAHSFSPGPSPSQVPSPQMKKCEIAKTNRASSKRGTQHKGGSIPNTEHKRRMDEFLRLKASVNSEGSSVQSNHDEFNLWLEVAGGKNKKGRIYSLEYEDQHIVSSAPPPSINLMGDFNIQELHTKMTHLKQETEHLEQENQHLKQTVGMVIAVLQGMGIQLPRLSNLANEKAPTATKANKKAENEN